MSNEFTMLEREKKDARRRDLIERIIIARVSAKGVWPLYREHDWIFVQAADLADRIIEEAP